MQPAPSPVFYEPPLAAKPQLREKPHQGLPSKNPTWNQGPNVCNFTVTLGLRATVVENGVGQTYSARYYNPATGRFLSRDPENGYAKIPVTLRKYLYAGGDPVNYFDPTGRELVEVGEQDSMAITFGHGARHLVGTGLSQAEVEAAIREAVQEIIDTCILNPGMHVVCVVNVGGIPILAKGFVIAAAWLNVGTYYPVP